MLRLLRQDISGIVLSAQDNALMELVKLWDKG